MKFLPHSGSLARENALREELSQLMNQKFNFALEEEALSWKICIYSEMLELHFRQDFFTPIFKLLGQIHFSGYSLFCS